MKKIICLITVFMLVFSLASCGEKTFETTATISATDYFTVLEDNGKITVEGLLAEETDFSDAMDVFAIRKSLIVLKNDGTLDVRGEINPGLEPIRDWSDIVKISGTSNSMVGLKSDGTVVAAGSDNVNQLKVSEWTDIVDISCSGAHTVGVKKDGTCVATGKNAYGECDVEEFTDTVKVETGIFCTVVLKKDGSAAGCGKNPNDVDNIKHYKSIRQIDVCENNGIILKDDGTVKFFGQNKPADGEAEWTNIIKVTATPLGYFGIDTEGKIFYHGETSYMEESNGADEITKNNVTIQ